MKDRPLDPPEPTEHLDADYDTERQHAIDDVYHKDRLAKSITNDVLDVLVDIAEGVK